MATCSFYIFRILYQEYRPCSFRTNAYNLYTCTEAQRTGTWICNVDIRLLEFPLCLEIPLFCTRFRAGTLYTRIYSFLLSCSIFPSFLPHIGQYLICLGLHFPACNNQPLCTEWLSQNAPNATTYPSLSS